MTEPQVGDTLPTLTDIMLDISDEMVATVSRQPTSRDMLSRVAHLIAGERKTTTGHLLDLIVFARACHSASTSAEARATLRISGEVPIRVKV